MMCFYYRAGHALKRTASQPTSCHRLWVHQVYIFPEIFGTVSTFLSYLALILLIGVLWSKRKHIPVNDHQTSASQWFRRFVATPVLLGMKGCSIVPISAHQLYSKYALRERK